MISIDEVKCNGCGICTDVCSVEAIKVAEGTASIDRDLCTECGLCISSCPQGALSVQVPGQKRETRPVSVKRHHRFARTQRGHRRRRRGGEV